MVVCSTFTLALTDRVERTLPLFRIAILKKRSSRSGVQLHCAVMIPSVSFRLRYYVTLTALEGAVSALPTALPHG
jgi:hypothetical protein